MVVEGNQGINAKTLLPFTVGADNLRLNFNARPEPH